MAETRVSSARHLSLFYATLCLWLQHLRPSCHTWFPSSPLGGDLELLFPMESPLYTSAGRGSTTSSLFGAPHSACSMNIDNPPSSNTSHLSSGSGSGSGSVEDDQTEGGYDLEFVAKIDEKYECPICCFVLRAPTQTKCGHRFCALCIKKWIREKTSPIRIATCPICAEELRDTDIFSDNFAKREIMGLHVHCPHREEGCEVVMEIRYVTKHLGTCDYAMLLCPNGCSQRLMRMNIQDHLARTCELRMIECPVCHKPIRIQLQELHIEMDCPMVEVACERCNAHIHRSKLPAHKKDDCPKVLVDCIFIKVGCMTKIERDQLDTHLHLSTQSHLRLLADTLEYLLRSTTSHEPLSCIGPQSDPLSSILPGADSVSTNDSGVGVTTNRTRLGNSGRSFLTYPTKSHQDLITSSVRLPQQLESLSLSIPTGYLDPSSPVSPHEREMPSTSERQPMHRRLSRQSSLSIVEERLTQRGSSDSGGQQQSNVGPEDLTQLYEKLHEQANAMAQQTHKMMDLLAHNRTLTEKVEQQQATIQHLEEQFQDFALQNCSGTFIWKVQNYFDKKMEAQRGSRTVIHSPGFYSSMYGYKLCVRLNLNGVECATGTHMSLFVHFMQGEYDDILDWPFSGRISLSILDQSTTTQYRQHITETLLSKPTLAAFQRPMTHRNHKGFGYVEFSPLSVIEGSAPRYRKNDTIYIKVKVETN